MRLILSIVILFFTIQGVIAQNIDLPSNPEPGKCYMRCLYYDKPIQWEETDCKKIKVNIENGFRLGKSAESKLKLLEYQKKLIALGYILEANGSLDSQTIKAHNKYLYLKKKEARKERRRIRRKKKSK